MSIDANYILSNKTKIPGPMDKNALVYARTLYHYCRDLKEIKQKNLQNLSNEVLKTFRLAPIPVKFSDEQPFTKKTKTLGVHNKDGCRMIQIYKFTAKKKKIRASKSAVNTLLHELMHEIDISLLSIENSIHCSGFYLRISQLKELLSK